MPASGGVEPAGHVGPARLGDQAVYIEEEVLARSVVRHTFERIAIDGVERAADRARIVCRDDALLGQHHEMRGVNGQQRLYE